MNPADLGLACPLSRELTRVRVQLSDMRDYVSLNQASLRNVQVWKRVLLALRIIQNLASGIKFRALTRIISNVKSCPIFYDRTSSIANGAGLLCQRYSIIKIIRIFAHHPDNALKILQRRGLVSGIHL